MVITIYSFKLSSPCRAVLLTAKQLNIQYNIIEINTGKNEQYDPEFVKVSFVVCYSNIFFNLAHLS